MRLPDNVADAISALVEAVTGEPIDPPVDELALAGAA